MHKKLDYCQYKSVLNENIRFLNTNAPQQRYKRNTHYPNNNGRNSEINNEIKPAYYYSTVPVSPREMVANGRNRENFQPVIECGGSIRSAYQKGSQSRSVKKRVSIDHIAIQNNDTRQGAKQLSVNGESDTPTFSVIQENIKREKETFDTEVLEKYGYQANHLPRTESNRAFNQEPQYKKHQRTYSNREQAKREYMLEGNSRNFRNSQQVESVKTHQLRNPCQTGVFRLKPLISQKPPQGKSKDPNFELQERLDRQIEKNTKLSLRCRQLLNRNKRLKQQTLGHPNIQLLKQNQEIRGQIQQWKNMLFGKENYQFSFPPPNPVKINSPRQRERPYR